MLEHVPIIELATHPLQRRSGYCAKLLTTMHALRHARASLHWQKTCVPWFLQPFTVPKRCIRETFLLTARSAYRSTTILLICTALPCEHEPGHPEGITPISLLLYEAMATLTSIAIESHPISVQMLDDLKLVSNEGGPQADICKA